MRRRSNKRSMTALLVALTLVLGTTIATTVLSTNTDGTDSIVPSTLDTVASDAEEAYASGVVEIDLSDLASLDVDDVDFESNTLRIEAAGVYALTGALDDGQIVIETKGKVYLELDGVNVSSAAGPALWVKNAKRVTIVLAQDSTNYLSDAASPDSGSAALLSNDSLYFTGTGTLHVAGNSSGGIASHDSIVVSNGTLVVQAIGDGLSANDDITINGGDVLVTGGDDGLDSNGTVYVNDGQLAAFGGVALGEGGVDATGAFAITGGTVVVGGNLLAPLSEDSRQTAVYVTSASISSGGTTVSLLRDGEVVFTYTPAVAYQNVLISSSELTSGVMYRATIGTKTANLVMASR